MQGRSRRLRAVLLILILCLPLFSLPASARTLLVNVSAGIGGSVTTSKWSVESGDTVIINAFEDPDYRFDYWEVVSGDPGNGFNYKKAAQVIEPESNVELVAHFATDFYSVIVLMKDLEGGTVNYNTVNYNRKRFAPDEEITLTVEPYDGFAFKQWESEDVNLGSAAYNQKLTFIMPTKNVVLYVDFELVTYHFRLVTSAGGRASVDGKTSDQNGEYECVLGEEIELLAESYESYLFSGWSGTNGAEFTSTEQESTTLICPASDFTVTARFASAIKELTVTSTEGGSVSPQEGTMRLGVENILELMAVPEEGYVFSNWECSVEDGVFSNPKKASTSFTMPNANCTITAVFVKGGYHLSLFPTVGGRVNEDAAGNYEMGDQISVVATPEVGYEFSRWDCDMEGVLWDATSAETVVTMPSEDVKITAVFALAGGDAKREDVSGTTKSGGGFPWGAPAAVLILSGVAIALIAVRERYNLSYRYLIRKGLRSLKAKLVAREGEAPEEEEREEDSEEPK